MEKLTPLLLLIALLTNSFFAHSAKVTLVTEHLPPYQMIKEDSSVVGFATEVVLNAVQRAELDYSLHGYPWVRSYNLALKKNNHCIYSIARLPSREKLFTWIGPVTEKNNAVIWSLKNNKHSKEIATLDDLKHYTTAVNKNDATHVGMLAIGLTEGENLYVLEHTESLINLLVVRAEIDFIVADDITITHRAKLAGVPIELLHRVIEVESLPLNFFLACNINTDKDIIEKLTTSLTNIHQDGTYQKIFSKWKSKMPHLK
ncbi:MAG: transporter substrate-binding domain-containing protein [Colwellia sp.]|nr:transporter substrate-binding domain-containing protein [Colwellia sp.]MCW9082638.1 transporter substrate-binding domain-containing protein [Colwellia sp.]